MQIGKAENRQALLHVPQPRMRAEDCKNQTETERLQFK